MRTLDVNIQFQMHGRYCGVMHMTLCCDNAMRKVLPIYIYVACIYVVSVQTFTF